MHPQTQNRVVFIAMIPTDDRQQLQKGLFELYLEDMINLRHPLVRMAERIDWQQCEAQFGPYWCPDNGRPGHPIRLHAGLQMLKHMQGLSDRELLDQWVENPYWQYFCGESVFQHEPPMDESTMGRFRRRIGEDGARALLKMTVDLGEGTGTVAPESFRVAVADTTVMPKAIEHPSEARLMVRAHRRLVSRAKADGVKFRQTYERSLDGLVIQIGRYAHARQFRRMHKRLRKLHGYLGRVCNDVIRQQPRGQRHHGLDEALYQALYLWRQYAEPQHRPKLYSLHEPEVDCIAKGKARTPYEFGSKVSVITTAREGFVLDCQALRGNAYDGHTLHQGLERVHKHCGQLPVNTLVDRGYRGSESTPLTNVHITGKKKGNGTAHARYQHRRNSVEPIIGHMKHEGLLDRCHLRGREGDRVHAVLCAVGFNLRKVLRRLARLFGLQFVRDLLAAIHQSGNDVPGSTPQLKPATA